MTINQGISIIRRLYRPIGSRMNLTRKKDYPSVFPVPAMAHRFWCAFFALWWILPIVFAEDFGLVNPAEKEFSDFHSDADNTGHFAKKTPVMNDRTLSAPKKSDKKPETIRQVSTSENDPFPLVTQQTAQQIYPFDGGNAAAAVPNYSMVTQNNVVPYDYNALGGYANPYTTYPAMPNMYPAGMEMGYFSQFEQNPQLYPQQFPQEYMMGGNNPQMDPNAQLMLQYGAVGNPYAMGYPADYQTASQEMPDYSAAYLAMMQQEMMRQQTEESHKKTSKEKDAEEAKKQADANWTLNNLVPVRISSPLGETMLACAKTMSPFCTPPGPDKGVGMPLVNNSWLDHPYYFGGFVGAVTGSELVSKMIKQKTGGTGGLIFGYNFNDYWGFESRLHFASIDIYDTAYAKQLIGNLNPDLTVLPTSRTNALTLFDVSAHYYPLGNAKWRPYFKYGLGFGEQKFVNSFGYTISKSVGTMPLGLGVRYWWNERLAIQADLTNNVIFASGITKTQHNTAFTVGLSYAFGTGKAKHPVHYWPATPSMGSKW